MKNLLFIIPSLGIGGAENAISKITLELAKNNNVYLCIFNRDIPIGFSYGGELISLDIPGGENVFQKSISLWRRVKKLQRLKKQLNIHAAVSFLEGADFINVLSRWKEKVVISVRSSKTHNESMIGHFDFVRNNILIPQLYKHADTIVAVQQNIVEELTGHFGLPSQKLTVINNFFDSEYILAKAAEVLDPDFEKVFLSPVIIAAGRLTEIKGFAQLIQAFAVLHRRCPSAKLIILGDGPLRTDLELKANSTGLPIKTAWNGEPNQNWEEASIIFLGHQSNPYKYFSRSAVFMLSSLSEGFPNAMTEAMVCGAPIASTDCPYGPREILAPGSKTEGSLADPEYASYGVLLPVAGSNNFEPAIHTWAKALEVLITDKNLHAHYVEQGKIRANNFSKTQIMPKWEQVLEL